MFKIIGKIDRDVTVALSGGYDSVAVVDFLQKKHNVDCVFFNHGTEECNNAERFVVSFCNKRNIQLTIGRAGRDKKKEESTEEYWRNIRYEFFDSLNKKIVTAHNLDDAMETFVYSSLHGTPKVIPYKRNNVVRPFLLNRKKEFLDWLQRHNIEWYEDKSNTDTKHMRNFIRHELMPKALIVNPGLAKTVSKIIQKKI